MQHPDPTKPSAPPSTSDSAAAAAAPHVAPAEQVAPKSRRELLLAMSGIAASAFVRMAQALGFGFAGLCLGPITFTLGECFDAWFSRCLPVLWYHITVLFGQVNQ